LFSTRTEIVCRIGWVGLVGIFDRNCPLDGEGLEPPTLSV
jgi:hypothetical protein